jgi:hypothetical protein
MLTIDRVFIFANVICTGTYSKYHACHAKHNCILKLYSDKEYSISLPNYDMF